MRDRLGAGNKVADGVGDTTHGRLDQVHALVEAEQAGITLFGPLLTFARQHAYLFGVLRYRGDAGRHFLDGTGGAGRGVALVLR